MTDIIERLREELADVRKDAALLHAEIERLQAMNKRYRQLSSFGIMGSSRDRAQASEAGAMTDTIERLRAVLLYISELDDDGEAPGLARRALEPKP